MQNFCCFKYGSSLQALHMLEHLKGLVQSLKYHDDFHYSGFHHDIVYVIWIIDDLIRGL